MILKETLYNLRTSQYGFFNIHNGVVDMDIIRSGMLILKEPNLNLKKCEFTILTKKDINIINLKNSIKEKTYQYIHGDIGIDKVNNLYKKFYKLYPSSSWSYYNYIGFDRFFYINNGYYLYKDINNGVFRKDYNYKSYTI